MEIVQFLRLNPDTFFARKEIARKARRRHEYEVDPHWASAPLNSGVAQTAIEKNDSGHYRLCEGREG